MPGDIAGRGRRQTENDQAMLHTSLIARRAIRSDIPAIRAMQERSIRVLGGGRYTQREIEGFLEAFSTMDDAVVDEEHYFILEDSDGRIIASAGWSQRPPGYSRGAEVFDQGTATVRSVFVDPDMARMGFGRRVMEMVEADARRARISRLEVASTLSGLGLYTALGYRPLRYSEVALPNGESFALLRMEKSLAAHAAPPEGRPGRPSPHQ